MSRARRDAPDEHYVAGRRPVIELLRSGGPVEEVFIAQGLAPSGILGEVRKRAKAAAVPVRTVPRAEVDRLAAGLNHQGVVARAGRFRYTALESLLGEQARLLFLDRVTDPHNLGALLRSADVAGFNGIVIPAHRAAGVTPAVRRVAAGAAEVVPVARVANIAQAVRAAKKAGMWVIGLDEKAEGDIWTSELPQPPCGLVLGSEDRGVSRVVREECDELLRIPQSGKVGSLNVAVAGAVCMFEMTRRMIVSASLANLVPAPALRPRGSTGSGTSGDLDGSER